jgi:hypothetical protein
MPPTCLLCLLSPFNRLSARRCVFAFGKFSIEVQKSEGVSGLIIYT